MQCVMCKEQIPDNASVCPHCDAKVIKTEFGVSSDDISAVIDSLNVSPRKKELFHLIHRYDLLQKGGFIDVGKAKKAGITFKDRFGMATSILAFLFTFIYYFVTGMWRKGLVILGLTLVVIAIIEALNLEKAYFLTSLPSLFSMMMAFGDQYRTKVLKEEFWM